MAEIGRWLDELGLGRFSEIFAENEISFEALPHLTADDLKDLGLPLGPRKILATAIADLGAVKSDAPSSELAGPVVWGREAERRQLTVMFCDLVGSTALSQRLDPEDLQEVLRRYRDHCAACVVRFGGTIAKFMGDGVLAYFSYPHGHEDDAERAVRASLAIVAGLQAVSGTLSGHLPEPLRVRIGIATGPVLVGDLRGEETLETGAVVGETPNLAARLQAVAEPDSVVIAPVTRRLVADLFQCKDLGRKRLKGIQGQVRVWQVRGEGTAESRFQALHGDGLVPLVGREDELGLLLRRWHDAEAGEGQVVIIIGEAGIGKSRLGEALLTALEDRPHVVLRYQCSPHFAESPFQPVLRQLSLAAGIKPQHTAGEKRARLQRWFDAAGASPTDQLPVLANLLSIPAEDPTSAHGPGQQERKEQAFQVLQHHLVALAKRRPVLVLFEDMHWTDASTAELLNRYVEAAEACPVLVLATTREPFDKPWIGQPHVSVMVLNRLSRRESRLLVDRLTGSAPLPSMIADQVVERTDGVPLFIEETAHTVLQLYRSDATQSRDAPHVEVPATLHDSFMARLDALGVGKWVAQVAAALGREFPLALLEDTCGLAPAELARGVDELIAGGILFRRGDASRPSYVFKHALLQDVAYHSLPHARLRRIHHQIAQVFLDRDVDEPALLAHHWECGGEPDRAVGCRLVAAERADSDQWARMEAATNYQHALRLLSALEPTPDRQHRYVDTASRVASLGSYFRTPEDRTSLLGHLNTAIGMAESLGDMGRCARLEALRGEIMRSEALFDQAVRRAVGVHDPRVEAEVVLRFSYFLGNTGHFVEALDRAERAIELYGALDDPVEQRVVMISAGRCYSCRAGQLDRAMDYADQARRLAETTGNRKLGYWLPMEIEPYMYAGDWARAMDIAERELPPIFEAGNWDIYLFCSGWAAAVCLTLDDRQAARAWLRNADIAARRLDNEFAKIYPQIAWSMLHLAEGDTKAANEAAQRALDLAEHCSAPLEKGAAYRMFARIAWSEGDRTASEVQFRRGIAILDEIGAQPELGQTLLAYGHLTKVDDRDRGSHLLRRALDIFDTIGATGWADLARRAIEA